MIGLGKNFEVIGLIFHFTFSFFLRGALKELKGWSFVGDSFEFCSIKFLFFQIDFFSAIFYSFLNP